jgi:hypothetical protein
MLGNGVSGSCWSIIDYVFPKILSISRMLERERERERERA